MTKAMTKRVGDIADPVRRQAVLERMQAERIARRADLLRRLRLLVARDGADSIWAELLAEAERKDVGQHRRLR